MEKDFVPYQESLELKELGFDEPCFGFYMLGGDFEFRCLSIKGHPHGCTYKMLNMLLDGGMVKILTPTFSQAFRFFREKYQASPSIHCMSEQGNSWRYHIPNEGGETDFLTYEDAELACLKKLIEIVKNK